MEGIIEETSHMGPGLSFSALFVNPEQSNPDVKVYYKPFLSRSFDRPKIPRPLAE